MANLSSVESISFETTSEDLAKKLLVFLKLAEAGDPYYNLLYNPTLDGNIIVGEGAVGRWSYSGNLNYAFTNPEQWFSLVSDPKPELQKAYDDIAELLKAGESITVEWSEEESGCDLYGDGMGTIDWSDVNNAVQFDYTFEDDDEARECDQKEQEDWDDEESDEA